MLFRYKAALAVTVFLGLLMGGQAFAQAPPLSNSQPSVVAPDTQAQTQPPAPSLPPPSEDQLPSWFLSGMETVMPELVNAALCVTVGVCM